MKKIPRSDQTIFYAIEKAIKLYRRAAQASFKSISSDITIDQLMLLRRLEDDPTIPHLELSNMIFRDMASISRMLSLLDKRSYIERVIDPENRRRFKTKVTQKGRDILEQLAPQVLANRKNAVRGLTKEDLATCIKVLDKISNNITKQ